ncbi:protocadherin Fat 4 isoform X2 [Magallana gigas]|uniref:protocadherin Fat 4 isoform X2 n=1 Tax=Magallana gigas TaxID=29159 RepID=UPI0033429973
MWTSSVLFLQTLIWTTNLQSITGNSFAPEILSVNVNERIPENTKFGVIVATVSASDRDTQFPDNDIRFQMFASQLASEFFAVDSLMGNIFVKKDLTLDTSKIYQVFVQAYDMGSPSRSSAINATVTIDVYRNLFHPYFTGEPFTTSITENIIANTSILQVNVGDDDTDAPFNTVTLSAIGDDKAPTYFRLDSDGRIVVIGDLKADSNTHYLLRILAQDGGSPSRTAITIASITVQRNLYAPVFQILSKNETILETRQLGLPILQVKATDGDRRAPNNVVRYSLTEGADDIECFLIDAQTGSLSLRRSLLYAPCTGIRYRMTVTATDLGLNPFSSTITVTVDVDRNANPPVFENIPAIAPINENQPTSQGFFTVRATDADTVTPFGDITYSLVGDGTATIYFQVDSSTGVLSLKQSIQPDTASTYRLTFRATDGGNPPKYDEKTLTVNVNRNLLAPEFVHQIYEVTIWEIQALDIVIQEVSARDNDTKAPHNEVTYEIVGDALAQTYFRIDNEGRIYVRRPLTDDNADTGLYTVSVRANDKGTPQRSSSTLATVRVNVLRNRNCPTFASSVVDISIDQSSVSRVIYDANATDPDAANTPFSTVRYSLIGDENAQVFFRVDDQTGQVFTNGPSLFSDQGTIYQLRVRAEDAVNTVTSCSGTLVLRVAVNRNLNSPQWTNVNTANNYVTTISETHSVSLSVYRIQAIDADDKVPNNVVSYAMTTNSPNRNLFFVDVDGFVYLRNSLVGITGDPFTVRFVATDGGNPARTSPEATLTVNVNRNQFPPEILNLPAEKEIQENQLVNEEIYRVNGRDNDTFAPFNAYSFELVGDGSSTTFFRVSPNGAVTLRQSISLDPANTFQLRVRVQDGGTPRKQDEGLLTIKVNKNLFSPVMTTGQYSRRILETQTVSLPLVTVLATDGDQFAPNNQLRYFIVGSNTTITDFFMVNEDSGAVMLRRSMLDYPNTATTFTVNFQVSAEDKGSVPRQANNPQLVAITVVRNTAPFFENTFTYNAEVQQFAPGGAPVFTPIGRDADSDSPFNVLTYSLIGDDAATTVFQINPNTGAISTRPTTNLTQTIGNFVARVQVTDGGSPPLSDTATVQITVQRNRENPRFLHAVDLTRNIPETLPVGSEIIDLNATDDDFFVPNNVISYVITGGDGNPLEYFFIHPSTGVIVLLKSVKSISISNFRLSVEARDQGAPMRLATATVRINVLRDTGVLAFSANNYNVTISENTPVGSSVTNTVASPGISIEYSLLGVSSGQDYFSVNAATGLVTVRQQLTSDPASPTFYQLRVQAINRGVTTQTATATVNIGVVRNENGPVFRPSNTYSTTVEDTIPLGYSVIFLTATDADGDQLNYRILSRSPFTDLFYLNPVTGQIALRNILQGRAENQYSFQVQVSDQRTPERTADAFVIVNVIKDRFAPQFIRTPYLSATTENTQDGTIIFSTEAIDQDLRGRIEYTVIGDNAAPAFFVVIPDRGNITIINQALLRKDVGTSYTLRLTAHDTQYPNNRANATVTIQVTRNLNSPVFSPPSYSRTILDTVPLGYQVVQVNATDGDNDPIRYSIIGDTRAQTYYYINPETGWITVKQLLTTGNWLQDQISVQACDLRDPQNCVSTFAIITIDRNEQSPFFTNTPYSESLGQGRTASETVIFTVTARDPDLNPSTGSLRYETIGNYPAPSFFSLNTTTGEIKVARGLMEDGLQRSQYNLVVIAYDTQYPADRATATVTFNVNRNPNSPVFTQSGRYLVTVPESLPLGSIVTQVLASDADNDVVSYFISQTGNTGQEDLDFFYLNAETGVITLKSLLTSTILNSFTFDVVARDPSGKTGNAVVTVTVTRDQPPVFVSTPYRTSVVENRQINSKIFTVAANDPDRKGQIVYGVVGSLNAPFYFGVDNSSGEVAVINDLKTDIRQQYDLVVTAYDSGSPGKTATATLTLTVVKNPSVPEITSGPHRVTIWEDRAPGSNIMSITARDNDGDTLRYELLSDGTAESIRALMYFTIDPNTGLVYVARTLMDDPTRAVLYKMKVRVRDQQYYEKQTEADVEITVLRNQQSPFFLGTYAREIPENTPMLTSILQVTARDTDMRPISSLRYEATGFGSAPYFFYLSPTNGSIYVQNDLRSEKNVFTYILQVQAYDVAYPLDRAVTNVTITIRRNENAPQFDQFQYSANISENTPRNVVVLRLNATDRDVGGSLRYETIGNYPAPSFFSLNTTTGEIKVARGLMEDGLQRSQYNLVVIAFDTQYPADRATATVTFNVNRNPNSPVFTQSGRYLVTVPESLPLGSNVTQVLASDADNDVVSYFISQTGNTGQEDLDFFYLNAETGVITLKSLLTSTILNSFTFDVVARDPSGKTGNAVVTVTITRDQPPVFVSTPYRTTIDENGQITSNIFTVSASDPDIRATSLTFSKSVPERFCNFLLHYGHSICDEGLFRNTDYSKKKGKCSEINCIIVGL